MQKKVIAITAVLVLILANYTIWQREVILDQGSVVLLKLAPLDPRSKMQGDYMALRYQMLLDVFSQKETDIMENGVMVLNLDQNRVASFSHFADNSTPDAPLNANQLKFKYRIRNGVPRLASHAFFFQEGDAQLYEKAEYGVFKVDKHGTALLTGLADAQFATLGLQQKRP